MKKVAVLSITAFYLLLTTGMFVCMIHCAAENAVTGSEMSMSMPMNHHDMDCCKKAKSDCTKKHSSFIVKENLKPATEVQFTQTALAAPLSIHADFLVAAPVVQINLPQQTKAPPDKSGKAIIIQNHSFLI